MNAIPRYIFRSLTRRLLKALYRGLAAKVFLHSDIQRWAPASAANIEETLEKLFINHPEFRSLFFYRIKCENIKAKILRLVFPPSPGLYICTPDIGPGLFIQHGFSTIIAAKQIGRNCWINQQVTVGYSDATHSPVIGNDVTINAGALIIGGVNIGDRAIIGAGAVVVKSVPADCTVVGNPAYIIRRNGKRTTESL